MSSDKAQKYPIYYAVSVYPLLPNNATRLVFTTLANHAHWPATKAFYMSYEDIAAESTVRNRRSISASLRWLEDNGYITSKRQMMGANLYTVVQPGAPVMAGDEPRKPRYTKSPRESYGQAQARAMKDDYDYVADPEGYLGRRTQPESSAPEQVVPTPVVQPAETEADYLARIKAAKEWVPNRTDYEPLFEDEETA